MTYSDIVFVGDRSGSMQSMGSAPQDGVREFLEAQRTLLNTEKKDVHVTVTVFDDLAETPFSGFCSTLTDADIERCVGAMLPRNCTRLFDTVIEAIDAQHQRMQQRGGNDDVQLIALFTDGQDNQSQATAKQMNAAVRQHRARGAVCQFLAANQDAIATGTSYGFAADSSMQVTPTRAHASSAFGACIDSTGRAVRSRDTRSAGFTQTERFSSATAADRDWNKGGGLGQTGGKFGGGKFGGFGSPVHRRRSGGFGDPSRSPAVPSKLATIASDPLTSDRRCDLLVQIGECKLPVSTAKAIMGGLLSLLLAAMVASLFEGLFEGSGTFSSSILTLAAIVALTAGCHMRWWPALASVYADDGQE